MEELATYPALPSGFFKISYLINEVVDKFLHISQLPDPNSLVSIHPLLTVGIVGLIVNAFNFMPIGRLDGGRVVMAIAGRNSANGMHLYVITLTIISITYNIVVVDIEYVIQLYVDLSL